MYGNEYGEPQSRYRDRDSTAYQAAVRGKEEDLINSALGRIAKARSRGKTNVTLSEAEMEALERRRGQQPEPPHAALASPPATPAKPPTKGKVGSRSNSSSNLASKSRKKSSGLFGSSPSPAKSNSKAKVNRKGASEQASPYPRAGPSSAMVVADPNGSPGYSPYAYYGNSSQEFARSQPASRRPSRSNSRRRRESNPPDRPDMYAPYPPRYYPPPSGMRPESSHLNRALPDDQDWYPPAPRQLSASSLQYHGYPSDYEAPPVLPAAQGRRVFSGPADVRYSSARHTPPTRPPAERAGHSDPALFRRQTSGLSQEIVDSSTGESSDSSVDDDDEDEEDEGVQVDVRPQGPGGDEYAISRSPPSAAVSGDERRRRSGRR